MARKRKSLKFLNILFIILGVILIAWGVNFFLGDRNQAEGEEEIEEPSNIVEEIPEDQEDQEDLEQQEQTEKEIKSVKISAAGDIMFHMSQINGGYDENTDTYNFKPFFEEIKPFIEEADISIANFEGTTAGLENGNVYKAWPVFNVPDETLDAVKYAGFDILSTVNNHSIDMGKDGIIRTIEQIEKRNMMKVGTRKSPDEERVNIIDEEKINEDIIYSKENDTDFIIAFMHWGGEYQRDPSLPQKDLADKMLSMGVDVILGSHPHVIQDSKTLEYDGEKKFIAYSMGNFISNQRYETLAHEYPNLNMYYTEDGVIVNLELEKDFETEEAYIKNIDFVPTWVNRIKVDGRYDYDILPIRNYLENNEVSAELKERMENSYTNTMNKMNTNLN
jgi:poly-gamma-glutamate synthesis protein (capsule biosynthesis protein)